MDKQTTLRALNMVGNTSWNIYAECNAKDSLLDTCIYGAYELEIIKHNTFVAVEEQNKIAQLTDAGRDLRDRTYRRLTA